jgi:hypothetical protein
MIEKRPIVLKECIIADEPDQGSREMVELIDSKCSGIRNNEDMHVQIYTILKLNSFRLSLHSSSNFTLMSQVMNRVYVQNENLNLLGSFSIALTEVR